MTETRSKYDLEERAAKFGEQIIMMCKTIKLNPIWQDGFEIKKLGYVSIEIQNSIFKTREAALNFQFPIN